MCVCVCVCACVCARALAGEPRSSLMQQDLLLILDLSRSWIRSRSWKFLQSHTKKQTAANKLRVRKNERGGGVLRNCPTWVSGVCCALSQWAQSTGDLLTAADQSGSERPGGVTPPAQRGYKGRRDSGLAAHSFCSSDFTSGLNSEYLDLLTDSGPTSTPIWITACLDFIPGL